MLTIPVPIAAFLSSYSFIFLIFFLVLIHLSIEALRHWLNLRKIPIRIHINGSRGKSSVTRLIAAGLREHDMIVCAKTSGILPCFIRPDGTEQAIYRSSGTDMLELAKIVKTAANFKPQVLIISCSAISPQLQSFAELKLVKSTHSVITNILEERLDTMGPTRADVALAFAGAISVTGKLYTSETYHLDILQRTAHDRETELIQINASEIAAIDDTIMQNFTYTEWENHPEKIALAIKLCHGLGVPRDIALRGMYKAMPDPETITIQKFHWQNQDLIFINAFSVNDAAEASGLWTDLLNKYPHCKQHYILFNCRSERRERSKEFAQAMSNWPNIDVIFVLGGAQKSFTDHLNHPNYLENIDWEPIDVLDKLVTLATENTTSSPILVVGMGNITGAGFKIFEYFTHVKHINLN